MQRPRLTLQLVQKIGQANFIISRTGTKPDTRRILQIPDSRKSLILLVGGAGFEPATLGL